MRTQSFRRFEPAKVKPN